MLNSNTKKEALDILERAVNKYNGIVAEVQKSGEKLYKFRKESIIKIEICENLVNSIANTPKEFNSKLVKIHLSPIFSYTISWTVCPMTVGFGYSASVSSTVTR